MIGARSAETLTSRAVHTFREDPAGAFDESCVDFAFSQFLNDLVLLFRVTIG